MVHGDASVRASFERAAAEADAARTAEAADTATRESEVAMAWEARDKTAAAAKAAADAKEAKHREQEAAELKERLELGVGTTEFRKQLVSEMEGSGDGFHGLDARTGGGLKYDESVRLLRSMRAELAAAAAKRKRALKPGAIK